MNQILIILAFEYKNFVKSASFIVMTVILLLVGIIGPAIPTISKIRGGSFYETLIGGERDTLALVDKTERVTEEVYTEWLSFSVEVYQDLDMAKEAMKNGQVSCIAEIDTDDFVLYVPSMKMAVYNFQAQCHVLVRWLYQTEQLAAQGLDINQAATILNYSPKGEIITVAASDNAKDYHENIIYAYVMIFMLYMGMSSCGAYVLTTVLREKSTKTMELLVTSCKLNNLIHGKVLGVALAALTQMLCLASAGLISIGINGMMLIDVESVSPVAIHPEIIGFLVVFFLLGIFTNAYLYAVLASTVSRMEDANIVTSIPMMLITFSFIVSATSLASPGAAWVTVFSYVPYLTPMVMFTRICLGVAATWEIALSIVLQLVVILGTGWMSGRIYRMATLMYGNKLNIKDIITAIKA